MLDFFKKKQEVDADNDCLVGVYADNDNIAMAYVDVSSGLPKVIACECHDAHDIQIQQEVLQRFVHKYNCQNFQSAVALPVSDYYISLIEAPEGNSPEEIKDNIRVVLKDEVDFDIDGSIIDYFELPTVRASDRRKMMYAIAAKITVVSKVVELVKNADLKPRYIDIQELVIRNIAWLTSLEKKGTISLFLNPGGGIMVISKNGSLHVTRNINLELRKLLPEAEALSIDDDQIHEVIDNLALEVQRSLDYCSSIFRIIPSKSILLLPSELQTKKMKTVLEEDLSLSVGVLSIKELFQIDDKFMDNLNQKTLLAIGSAIRNIITEEKESLDAAS